MSDGGLFRSAGTRTLHPDDEYSNTGVSKGWRLTDWDGENVYFKVEYDASGDVSLSTKDQADIMTFKNDGTGIEFGGTQAGFALDFIKAKSSSSGFRLKNFTDQDVLTLGISGTREAEFTDSLSVVGNFAINTNKFTLNATTGNAVIAGTLAVAGAITGTTITGINTAISNNTTLANTKLSKTETADQSILSGLSLAAGKTFGITSGFQIDSSSNLTGVGNVTLGADKVLALESSVSTRTFSQNLNNASGLCGQLGTASTNRNVLLKLGADTSNFIIENYDSTLALLSVGPTGIITGPSAIPDDVTDGVVNAKLIDSNGVMRSARNVNTGVNHITFITPSGVAGAITTNTLTTTYGVSSDPTLKNFADEELSIEMVKDEFTNKYIPTIHAFRFKADPYGPLVLGHDAWEATDAKLMTGLGVDRIGPRDAELGSEFDTGEKDKEGNPIMDIVSPAGVDQGKVTPMHGLMIQHLLEENELLKARLDNAGIA